MFRNNKVEPHPLVCYQRQIYFEAFHQELCSLEGIQRSPLIWMKTLILNRQHLHSINIIKHNVAYYSLL